ncbi:polymeric immunoglobulin receptor isoform X2 [Nothobranchius furzeri]|uniref:polymeric immunoglobulin receptor isoform X2 n=1 Tax=Nothobranchius furzeri TaxID=105023 RepID=UPI0024045937|nr:polymeric immunoglobulin receptor isoform X2 [Nothobranchius furzeri]
MWSLHHLHFMLYVALSCVTCTADVIQVFGYEGRDVSVSCPYGGGYEKHEKYLCRNECGSRDVLITTSQTNETKYSIYDDRRSRIFTTTISTSRFTDAGKYWCGVTRDLKDVYTEVRLKITPDSCCNSTTQIKADGEGSVSIRCPYESENEDSLKYICRGKQPSTCLQRALITSSRQSGRFSFTDDKKSRTFTITIYNLTLEDSGSYLCGVQSDSGLDDFSAVELEVKEWCCVIPKNMTGVVGQSVTVQCPYPPEDHNNRKFICKGNKHDCRDVMMMMMMMSQNRFMLHDESSSSFSVTITNLEASDTGTFWCRSDSEWRVGNYTQFHLSVVSPPLPETGAVFYVLLSTPAALLLIPVVVVLVMVCKHRCSKVKEPEVIVDRNNIEAENNHEQRNTKQQNPYQEEDESEADYENITRTLDP